MDITLQNILDQPLDIIIGKAGEFCNRFCGKFEACSIVNARSGMCSGDCRYCAQSQVSSSDIDVYPLLSDDEIIRKALWAKECGAERFSIVTSGEALNEGELMRIGRLIPRLIQKTGMKICASLGILSKEALLFLKESGLTRYHHNIESSPGYYPRVVSTHSYDDRVRTALLAKEVGLELCCGGIIGMGETWEDRLSMVLEIKKIRPDAVPLNLFIPIKGTPLGDLEIISGEDALRSIALFRIVLEDIDIKLIAGRELIFGEGRELMPFKAGANGMMVGGYLTVPGGDKEKDLMLLELLKGD